MQLEPPTSARTGHPVPRMLRRVLSRLRGSTDPDVESIHSPLASDSNAETEQTTHASTDGPETEAKPRMFSVAREDDPPQLQPSPPSFSTAAPSEERDPLHNSRTDDEIKPDDRNSINSGAGKHSSRGGSTERADDELALLLATAENDDDANEIIKEYESEEGRKRLRVGESTPEEESGPITVRRRRAARSALELDDLIGSDEEKQAIASSIRMNPEKTDGITTRRGTVVGRGRKRSLDEARGVPLSDKRSQKQNFIERNRRSVIENAIEMTKPKDDDDDEEPVRRTRRSGRRKSKPETPVRGNRRSSRLVKLYKRSDISNEEHDSDASSDVSGVSMHSTGSGGEEDEESSDSDSPEPMKDVDDSEEENDEEYDDELVARRKRIKISIAPSHSIRRSGRLVGKHRPKPRPPKKTKHKKKTARRRTNPNSLFDVEAPENILSEQEKRARLEALVKQSEDVTKKLNEAMAAEKERNQATNDANTAASPGRTSRKSEGEVFWPTGEGREMQTHQIDGVRWLLTLDSKGLNAILADEMGLGKTIQSIAFLATVLMTENRGPHIVVAPKNVVPHWAKEFEVFYPGKFRVLTHIGAGGERFERLSKNLKDYPDFDVLVTSFDLALRDLFTKPKSDKMVAWENRHVIRRMQKLEFEYAVVDEAHRLKNNLGQFNKGLRNYKQVRRRLLLTGTPLSNNLRELWSLMNVLNPRIFGSSTTFDSWFSAPFDTSRGGLNINEQSVIVDRLHTIIRPFFRRRLRADVCPSYSSADEVVIQCPQSAIQKALASFFRKCSKNKELSVNNAVMMHRKIANHPFIVSHALFDFDEVRDPNSLVGSSGKFLFLYWALPRLIAGGHRVLLFSQFRMVLDFIEDLMDLLNMKYGRLDGETTNENRENTVAKFNEVGSDIPVFLLTTRAGGVGLNLQTADTVILFDSDWNPSADLQAVSRIQRIGQKRTVHIMRLVTENSVDEVIVERGREKLRTEALAVGAGKFNTNVDSVADTTIRQKDLEQLLADYEKRQQDRNSPELYGADDSGTGATCSDSISSKYYTRWDSQLLRKDERSLPKYEGDAVKLSVDALAIPEWIRPGYDTRCTSYALRCNFKTQVPEAIEKAKLENAARSGVLPAKRERRKRVNLKIFDDLSADEESEYNASEVESDASEKFPFVPDSQGRKRGPKPKARKQTQQVPNIPNGQPLQSHVSGGHAAAAPVIDLTGPVTPFKGIAHQQPIAPRANNLIAPVAPYSAITTEHILQSYSGASKQCNGAVSRIPNQAAPTSSLPGSANQHAFAKLNPNRQQVIDNQQFQVRTLSKPKIEPMSDKSLSPHGQLQSTHVASKVATGSTPTTDAPKHLGIVHVSHPGLRMQSAMSPIARPIHRSSHSSPISKPVHRSPHVSPARTPFAGIKKASRTSHVSRPVSKRGGAVAAARHIVPRPVQGEVIVISDSDDDAKKMVSPSKKNSASRQATITEMRATTGRGPNAKREAEDRRKNAGDAEKGASRLEKAGNANNSDRAPETNTGGVDPALIATLREFTGVKDQAALEQALQDCNLDVHQAADQILMCD